MESVFQKLLRRCEPHLPRQLCCSAGSPSGRTVAPGAPCPWPEQQRVQSRLESNRPGTRLPAPSRVPGSLSATCLQF